MKDSLKICCARGPLVKNRQRDHGLNSDKTLVENKDNKASNTDE